MFPLIQNQYTQGRASSGGFRKPLTNSLVVRTEFEVAPLAGDKLIQQPAMMPAVPPATPLRNTLRFNV